MDVRSDMPRRKQLRIMVASTVYHFEDQLRQVCAVLSGFGYDVWNSHAGTIPQHPGLSNLDTCVRAAKACDVFLGFVRPHYGTGKVGERSITHEEFRAVLADPRPRWFMVHRDVTCARGLLKPYMFKRDRSRTSFTLRKNPILDDLRVIDLYHDAIQDAVELPERRGHWVQEFHRLDEVLTYLDAQFKDVARIRRICEEMKSS